jgi:hypothetical protein
LDAPRAVALDFTNLEGGPGVGVLYVASFNSVTAYLWPNAGNASPIRTLSGPATGLSHAQGLALDFRYNELVVLNAIPPSVNVYSRTASGDAAPLRTLSGPATGLSQPWDLALDYTNLEGGPGVGVLYVANLGSVTAHPWPNAGNASPIRTLSGPATQLASPSGLVLDLANDELVVVNGDLSNPSVTVYSRTDSGNTGPLRILAGAVTGLSAPTGVAVTASVRAVVDRDFNGDGKSDILWRHASGALTMTLMNGANVVGSADFGIVPTDWTIAGIGDFNGDRRADLLLRHTSGVVAAVLMNGTAVAGAGVLGTMTAEWIVERVGDFNGDGRADALWRHASGTVSIWFIDGTRISGTAFPDTVGTDWQTQ